MQDFGLQEFRPN